MIHWPLYQILIMYTQEISIEILKSAKIEEVLDAFNSYVDSYRGSGQTLGTIESQYITENRLVCLPFTHEADSLDRRYDNFYVTRSRLRLEELCGSSVAIRTLGKPGLGHPCQCDKPEHYLLMTDYLSIESPVRCGNCDLPVPLYRLPQYYDHGYMPILSWCSNYISCDRLQMNCEVGERWAMRQMQDLDSPLNRQGREICRKIEELTGVPTYYFLFNYSKYKRDSTDRPCPGCGGEWGLASQLHGRYDFKCESCRLVSMVSQVERQ